MKIINYFSDEITNMDELHKRREEIYEQQRLIEQYKEQGKEIDFDILEPIEPQHKLIKKQYKTNEQEFEYWLDVIKKTYGEYGEVTVNTVENNKTKDQILAENMSNLNIESNKKDMFITQLTKQINDLNIEINKLKGGQKIE